MPPLAKKQFQVNDMRIYRVLVLGKGRTKPVSYPGRGFPLYTRRQAIEILKHFAEKGCRNAYAEASTHRFDLDWLVEYPNWPDGLI
jgi:hypothetical protein